MHREPLPVAFAVSAAAASILATRPSFDTADIAPILVGSTLTAATTGLAASVLQFLPQRLFVPFAVVASATVWLVVSGLLTALGPIWLGAISGPIGVAWPLAAATALLVSRASGMQTPRLRTWRIRRPGPRS